ILGEKVKCYVILDSDFYTESERNEIITSLNKQRIQVHIWERKELENYLIERKALYRMFCENYSKKYPLKKIPLSEKQFESKIDTIIENFKNELYSQILSRKINLFKGKTSEDLSTIILKTQVEFEKNWKNDAYRIKIIPGKEFFK